MPGSGPGGRYDIAGFPADAAAIGKTLGVSGTDIRIDQYTVDIVAEIEAASLLAGKKAVVIQGQRTVSRSINYDNKRGDEIRGATAMSNINGGGSRINYTGSGKVATVASATVANPSVFAVPGNDLTEGEIVFAFSASGGTWRTKLNNGPWTVSDKSGDNLRLKHQDGSYLSGVGLGTLTGAILRNRDAMAMITMFGSFDQSLNGMTFSASAAPQAVIWVGANNKITDSPATFSGSETNFYGGNITGNVGDALVVWENHKFAKMDQMILTALDPVANPGANQKVLRVGAHRADSPETLLAGGIYNGVVDTCFIFGEIELRQAIGFDLFGSQMDANKNPSRIYSLPGSIASQVNIDTALFTNEGGATGYGAAVSQGYSSHTSAVIPYTGAWVVQCLWEFDYDLGLYIGAGMIEVMSSQFRGRLANNLAILIGPRARQEQIRASIDVAQMTVAGNLGIRDMRGEPIAITGASKTNPVVLTVADLTWEMYLRFANGERFEINGVTGMTELNGLDVIGQAITATSIALWSVDDCDAVSAPINGTAFGTYVSGGTIRRPYMVLRENIGPTKVLTVGHSDFVFDNSLAQTKTMPGGAVNVLKLENVPIIGGRYEVMFSTTVDMNGVSGAVDFEIVVGGVSYPLTSMEEPVATSRKIPITVSMPLNIPGISATDGSTVSLKCTAPSGVNLPGKNAAKGRTVCQIRRLP